MRVVMLHYSLRQGRAEEKLYSEKGCDKVIFGNEQNVSVNNMLAVIIQQHPLLFLAGSGVGGRT